MATAKRKEISDAGVAAVVSHPLRNRCLTILTERTASPSDIAAELSHDVSNVAYHVKRLVDLGHVEAVGTRPVRGAVEHFYRAINRPLLEESDHATLSVEERLEIARYVAQLSFSDISTSIAAGTFVERTDHHVTRLLLHLDERGWKKLQSIYVNALEQAFEVEAESSERMSADPDIPSISTRVLSFVFEMPQQKGSLRPSSSPSDSAEDGQGKPAA